MTVAKLLCDVRGKYRLDFLREIEEQSGGEIQVSLIVGDRGADLFSRPINTMKRDWRHERLRKHHMQDTVHQSANLDLVSSNEFHDMATMAIDHFQRVSKNYNYNSHNLDNLQDYLDYYYILTNVIAQRMIDEDITHVVFFMTPHLGYDTVLYQVAKSLGIKTLVMNQQSLFNDRFFSSGSIDDYGIFDPSQSEAPAIALEQGKLPDLFFMKDDWQKPGATGKLNAKAVGSFLKYVVRREPSLLLKPHHLHKLLKRVSNVYGSLPEWRDPFANYFHKNALAYYEHLAEFDRGSVDYDQKYVYVPLHNQPEMSASTLGGRYRDQLLMIEAIARSVPDDWKVYVKENPRQGVFARGPFFFHRLSRIPNVEMLPSFADSAALVANAQIVGTVAGTAGWEGLLSGVPAVVFGGAWYRSLPGVTPYQEGLDFEKIAAAGVDHTALEKAYGALVDRSHKGAIDGLFFDKIEGFNSADNAACVAKSVIGLIRGDVPTTYGTL